MMDCVKKEGYSKFSIVIGPSGIFLIETKNWSRASIENNDFFSPVEQIKRNNYALFCYLNGYINGSFFSAFNDNWGSRKISPRNVILMINSKPKKEFQFVKILFLSEVCNYITYFDKTFNDEQVKQLIYFLSYGN